MPTTSVQCLLCGSWMVKVRTIALARHTHVADTTHTKWECHTPDCGNELVVEDDSA